MHPRKHVSHARNRLPRTYRTLCHCSGGHGYRKVHRGEMNMTLPPDQLKALRAAGNFIAESRLLYLPMKGL